VSAEGIETALAASFFLDRPAWAAVSAGNMGKALMLPPAIRDVVIAADHDEPGRRAARQAAARWEAEGRRVRVATPDKPGTDFADLMKARLSNGRR
jgi:putative DNA primase/helicase